MDDEKEISSNTFSGKLFKKGKFNKAWKTRYFIVDRQTQIAQYFEKQIDLERNKNEKGHFDLNIISKIEVSPTELTEDFLFNINAQCKYIALNEKIKSDNVRDKRYTFYLVSSPRTFVLAAPNESDLMQWLQFLHSSLYGKIIKEGSLKKQGGLQKAFKSRYFILNEFHRLKYYDDEQLTHCLGAIDCNQITDIQHGNQYTFNIHIASRKWVLSAQNEEERSEWVTSINNIRDAHNTELKINKRPMDDDSGYLERPILDEKEKENEPKTNKPMRVHKRPKDDDSGFFERPNLNTDDLQEINEFDVIDRYNRWNKAESNSIYCAFGDAESEPFQMNFDEALDPSEFMVDFGEHSVLKRMDVQFYRSSYCTKIMIYASATDDKNDEWKEIGETQINSKPDKNAKISVTIHEYNKEYRCIKVMFGGEVHGDRENAIQISRLRFFGVSGNIQKRNDITDKIDVFQTSYEQNDAIHIFKDNDEEWRHRFDDDQKDEDVFIIFDTHGYVLNQIDLEFSGNDASKISLKIKCLSSDDFTLQIDGEASVDDLKEEIVKFRNIAPAKQKLVCKGKVLESNKKLKDYKISDETTVVLMVRKAAANPSNDAVKKSNRSMPTITKRVEFYETNTPNASSSFQHIESYDTNLVSIKEEKQKEKVIEKQRVRLDLKKDGVLAHARFIKIKFIGDAHESWLSLKRIKLYGDLGEKGELNEIVEKQVPNDTEEKTSAEALVNNIALTQMMGGMMNMMNNINMAAHNPPETKQDESGDTSSSEDAQDEHASSDKSSDEVDMAQMMSGMMGMMMGAMNSANNESNQANPQNMMAAMMGSMNMMNNAKAAPDTTESPDSDDAIDLSQSVKILQSFPETEDRSDFLLLKGGNQGERGQFINANFWYIRLRDEDVKEAWITFDTSSLKIDAVEISFPSYDPQEYHAKTIKVFTAKTLDSEWKQIDIKTDIPITKEQKMDPMAMIMGRSEKPTKYKFHLNSQHDRYIKLAFSELTDEKLGLLPITWLGFEEKIADEITDQVNVYQCSGETDKASEAEVILRANNSRFTAASGDKAWIVFDLGRYEVNRIKITFGHQSKPKIVKLRMSDVAPLYSFKIPSAMRWNLDTIHSFDDNEWENVSLVEELQLSGNEYNKNGFKRFIHLEFSKYSAEQLKIVRIQFFGVLSTRITAEDDEQFLDADEIKDVDEDNAPYEPTVADHSPAQSGFPVENIFDPDPMKFWMPAFVMTGGAKFLVLDLGNNEVEHVTVKVMANYPFSTVRVSTSNKSKTQKWNELFVDNEMESKVEDGGTYDLRKYPVDKFIKLEFEGLTMPMVAITSVKFYGSGAFLEKMDNKEITLEDIKNMEFVDDDIIAKYQQKLQARALKEMQQPSMLMQQQQMEILSDGWREMTQKIWKAQYCQIWRYTELNAYAMKTTFERDEMLQLSKLQKESGIQATKMMMDFQIKSETKKKELAQQEEKAKELLGNQPDSNILSQKFQKAVKAKEDYDEESRKEHTELAMELAMKANEHQAEDKNTFLIYEAWKDAVLQHPMELSLEYNADEYEKAMGKAGTHDQEGYKKCMSKLADLFDDSLKQRKALLHKFFVYQLSTYYSSARPHMEYDMSPVTIVFDCGAAYDRKIQRVEFKIDKPAEMNRIVISTANELQIKDDDVDDDDDEKDNFKPIAEWRFNKDDKELAEFKKENGLGFDDIAIVLNYQNRRYVKVEFMEFEEENSLEVQRMKVYVVNKNGGILDDDAKEDGEQLKKYKLKMIEENTVRGKYDHHMIENAYEINNRRYETTEGLKKPYLIFDCEQWKVDKLEMVFSSGYESRAFERMTISTAASYVKGHGGDSDGWDVIFDESECSMETYNNDKEPKIIPLNGKHQRYLKITMIVAEKSEYIAMEHLKFYTNCNPDPNIKNLASQMTIISATKCKESRPVEAILENTDSNYYRSLATRTRHIDRIKDRIRDEVCCGVNLLRKSRGGSISKKEKHFIKFLLCFKNDKCYNEMLYSAKLVMKLLRKPLDVEYNRLQSIKSRILTLKLDTEHKCKGVTSNHKLLEWDYSTWYKPKTAMFWPQDLRPLTQKWAKVGLTLPDPEFSTIRRTGILSADKTFISSEQLAMKYLNAIAYILDPSFQATMREIFKENRNKLNLSFPVTHNEDIGVQSGPVKTEARQKIKILLKYFKKQPPQCMAVLDIVRCGIVCEDDVELCSLFDLIMKKFSGSILRVKNAFDDIKKGDDSHGYRAVMINIAYGDTKYLPKGYQMVCEAQLLLNKYYQVRKNMHLGYGICRSEDGGISHNKAPYAVLAQDACKLGKLDI